MTRRFIETTGIAPTGSRNRPAKSPVPLETTVGASALPTGAATEATVSALLDALGTTADAAWDGAATDATLIAIAKRQVNALDDLRAGTGFVPSEDPIFFLGAS